MGLANAALAQDLHQLRKDLYGGYVEAAGLQLERVAPRPGSDVEHPTTAEIQSLLLVRWELIGAAKEIGDRYLIALEVIVHHDDGLGIAAVICLHRLGVRLPGIQIHRSDRSRIGA